MLQLNKGDVFAGNYLLTRLIDTGGFADVWEATYRVTGDTVALKIYPRLEEKGMESLESEYKNLFRLQHTHLVKALHFDKQEGYPFLVMVYYEGGNGSRKIGEYSEAEIGRCLYEMAGALHYLHTRSIVHKDIKPNNFLLDGEGHFYLADLGLSSKMQQTMRLYTRPVEGTAREKTAGITPPQYRAPELWKNPSRGQESMPATDIWAFGASLYEMISGDVPYGDLGGRMQMSDPYLRPLGGSWPEELNAILVRCMDREPGARPTAATLEKWAARFLETGKWKVEETGTVMPWPGGAGAEGRETIGIAAAETVGEKKKGGLRMAIVGGVVVLVAVITYYLLLPHPKPARPDGASLVVKDTSRQMAKTDTTMVKKALTVDSIAVKDSIAAEKARKDSAAAAEKERKKRRTPKPPQEPPNEDKGPGPKLDSVHVIPKH